MQTIEQNKTATQIKLRVITEQRPVDMLTPVNLYLKIRDRFAGSIMLESADNQHGRNSKSFIGFDRLAGITSDKNGTRIETVSEIEAVTTSEHDPLDVLGKFISSFIVSERKSPGLMGFIGYNAIQFIEPNAKLESNSDFPFFHFSLFRFVIEFDHLKQTLHIVQHVINGAEPLSFPDYLLNGTPGTVYPFGIRGSEIAATSDEQFLENVKRGKQFCKRGDVFQVVLSRRFEQQFSGDDFNVYRALRMINPSPYLFYADFGNFRLFGSSPEALLISKDGEAEIHPIAGTYRKTGDDEIDRAAELALTDDKKENAEHIMLVDLARNDLSRFCSDVEVKEFRTVQQYSHVLHLVSKVTGKVNNSGVIEQLKNALPAGTLSGAPKVRAMQIINETEDVSRDWYGGGIGTIGFDGSLNTAILIRTFKSENNKLQFQAGAGIVIDSNPESELNEINNKLGALRAAVTMATNL